MMVGQSTLEPEEISAKEILLVEDNPGDVRLLEEAMTEATIEHQLHVVSDGRTALEFIRQQGKCDDAPRPDIVLLDLNLPQLSGDEVLEILKGDDEYCEIPVLMLTSSNAPENVRQAYRLGANAYLTKPIDPDEFVDIVESIERFWLTTATLPVQR